MLQQLTQELHTFLSLKSLNVKIGDEIIPNISFIVVLNAIIYNGATPHIVDTTENELNICPEKLENYLVKNTKIVNNNCINKNRKKNCWNNCCSYLWS